MTTPSTLTPPSKSISSARPRRVHMVLRDGASLDGKIYLTEGQSLALYLGSRKGGWVNIVDVVWADDPEPVPHLVLQVDHIALAASTDGDIPAIVGSSVTAQRWVQVGLENGARLRGCLFLAERQRLSDYLYTVGKFLPVTKVVRLTDNTDLGDVALNCASIKLIRDVAVPAAGEAPPPAAEATQYSVFVVDDTPVTREAIRTDAASMTLLTPGRLPDRRAGETRPQPQAPASVQATPPRLEAELVPLTLEQQRGVERASRHWLGQLAARRGLAPAVPRLLSHSPSTGEVWRAICAANDMAEEELAALIGADLKLGVVSFETMDPRAVAIVPGRIARRLNALPVRTDGKSLFVATADPLDPDLDQQLRFVTRLRIDLQVAPPTALGNAIEWWYPNEQSS